MARYRRGLLVAAPAVVFVFALALASGSEQEQQAPFQIGVRVFDQATRQPVDAAVMVTSVDGPRMNRRGFEADEAGSLLVRDAAYGPVWIVAHAPGYGRAFGYFFADPRVIQEVELLLPKGASIYGLILDDRGQPLSEASIKVRYKDSLLARLEQSPARAAIERATAEGFQVKVGEADWHRGCRYTSCGSMGLSPGEFSVLDIDPNRSFLLVVKHDSLGTLESGIYELAAGERLNGVALSYQSGDAHR